ncbi:MAG: glycosyltransferase family 2 protein [Parachlamydiales bacterium]|nr:glycosyltransferase family 2 protein [Parachlamydiales bacterium]
MISVVILTKNSSNTIEKTLKSVQDFDEVILLDTGSEDDTIKLAKNFKNVKIFKEDFLGFGPLRNLGASFTKNDWILALDSDEVLSDKLIIEIKNLTLDTQLVYQFPFYNFYNERHIKCCGWQNESHVRLYNKKITKFSDSLVHEKLIDKNLKIYEMKNPIIHTPYLKIEDFLIKMNKYSSLFAQQNKGKKRSSFKKALFHSIFAFFKSYIIKKGIFYGKEGFLISTYNANTALYKYLKLLEINKK